MDFPPMVNITQTLVKQTISDPGGALDRELNRSGVLGGLAGRRVAVAVGSRNIDRLVEVLSRLVERLDDVGSSPFIVPAMGSHGNATAEGQEGILRAMGIDEERIGAPVVSSMETVPLGRTPGGSDAFMDSNALDADAIIVVNRVAPHTGYSGRVQSGVVKMLAVGLGKADGAVALHRHGFSSGHLIGEAADLAIDVAPPVTAVALVEDGTKSLSRLEVLRGDEIRSGEPVLLALACSMWPRIPVREADILIVDEMGKDISGTGMDPLVTGRGKDLPSGETHSFKARCVVALALTPGSGGNATGVGHADIITEKLYQEIDFQVTQRNVITSGALHRARIPIVAGSDREAVSMALSSLGGVSPEEARVVRIRNTRNLDEIQLSTALTQELKAGEAGTVVGEAAELGFDEEGNIT